MEERVSDEQNGFRPKGSCLGHIYSRHSIIKMSLSIKSRYLDVLWNYIGSLMVWTIIIFGINCCVLVSKVKYNMPSNQFTKTNYRLCKA